MSFPPSKTASRSLENPSNPITCDSLTSGGGSNSGEVVTPVTSWNYSAVYAAIRLLSETIAQLPLNLYRKSGDAVDKATEHPYHTLLHDSPSPLMSSFVWRETQMAHTLSYGNGYAYISREAGGRVVGLQLLSAAQTIPYINPDGSIIYHTSLNGKTFTVAPIDMLHIPAMGWDGIQGKSPITMHRETLGLSQAATKFGSQMFGEGTNVGSVIATEAKLSNQAKENLKQGFDKYRAKGYTGALLLDEGMTFSRTGINPDDAQFLETRRFQISEVARIFNIPPHMLRDLEKSSFNNIAEQSLDFLRFTMAPWLVKWEHELNRKLLTEDQRQTLYFKFSAAGLLRGTQATRYEAYASGIQNGWLTRNEVRDLEELNPIDGLDDVLIPLNMETQGERDAKPIVEQDAQTTEVSSDVSDDDDAENRSRYDAIARNAAGSLARFFSTAEKKAEIAKIPAMIERHIAPVFAAAGVVDIASWTRWLADMDLTEPLPDAEAIYTRMMDVINGN